MREHGRRQPRRPTDYGPVSSSSALPLPGTAGPAGSLPTSGLFDGLVVLTADELAAATVIWDPTVDVDLLHRQLEHARS